VCDRLYCSTVNPFLLLPVSGPRNAAFAAGRAEVPSSRRSLGAGSQVDIAVSRRRIPLQASGVQSEVSEPLLIRRSKRRVPA